MKKIYTYFVVHNGETVATFEKFMQAYNFWFNNDCDILEICTKNSTEYMYSDNYLDSRNKA